jgi:hypothetical protein
MAAGGKHTAAWNANVNNIFHCSEGKKGVAFNVRLDIRQRFNISYELRRLNACGAKLVFFAFVTDDPFAEATGRNPGFPLSHRRCRVPGEKDNEQPSKNGKRKPG